MLSSSEVQVTSYLGEPQFLLKVKAAFDAAALATIDASASIAGKSTLTELSTGNPLNYWTVSSASGTFLADALAHIDVITASEDLYLVSDSASGTLDDGVTALPPAATTPYRTATDELIRATSAQLDDGTAHWYTDQIDLAGAQALNADGTGVKMSIIDLGLPCRWVFKTATIAADPFSRTSFTAWRDFLFFLPEEDNVLVNTGESIDFKVDGSAVTVTFDVGAGPYDDLQKVADKIDTDLTGGFCKVIRYDWVGGASGDGDINDPNDAFGQTRTARMFIGSDSNMPPNANAAATIEIVSGTAGTLEKLGLVPEVAVPGETIPNHEVQFLGDCAWFKYMRPDFPHPVMSASSFDLDNLKITHSFLDDTMWPKRWFAKDDQPGVVLPPQFPNIIDTVRNIAGTSDSATREFTIDPSVTVTPDGVWGRDRGVGYSIPTLVNLGIQEGDTIVLSPGTNDEFSAEVEEVLYQRPELDNVANIFKLKATGRDKNGNSVATFPAAVESQTNLVWDHVPLDSMFPYYEMLSGHSTPVTAQAIGRASDGYPGVSPGAEIISGKYSASSANIIEVVEHAIAAGADIMSYSTSARVSTSSTFSKNFIHGPGNLQSIIKEFQERGGIVCGAMGNEGTNVDSAAFERWPLMLPGVVGCSGLGPQGNDYNNPPGIAVPPRPTNPDSTIYDRLYFATNSGSPTYVSGPAGNGDGRKFFNPSLFPTLLHDLMLPPLTCRSLDHYKQAPVALNWKTDTYHATLGTSMTSPTVAGLLALVMQSLGSGWNDAKQKAMTAVSILAQSADSKVGAPSQENRSTYGFGRINARRAVELALLNAKN